MPAEFLSVVPANLRHVSSGQEDWAYCTGLNQWTYIFHGVKCSPREAREFLLHTRGIRDEHINLKLASLRIDNLGLEQEFLEDLNA